MKCTRITVLIALFSAVLASPFPVLAQLGPAEAASLMGRGINLGNTLEPPFEGAWNNAPAEEHYFDDFAAAGFSTVRIPVRWDEHTQDAPPYAVDSAWMDRVAEVLGWALRSNHSRMRLSKAIPHTDTE